MFIAGTVTSNVYLGLLSNDFIPLLMRYGIPINSVMFQQDCAEPHIKAMPSSFLEDFEETVLSNWFLRYLRKDFRGINISGLKVLQFFSLGMLEG
jgi:hypothetical protein